MKIYNFAMGVPSRTKMSIFTPIFILFFNALDRYRVLTLAHEVGQIPLQRKRHQRHECIFFKHLCVRGCPGREANRCGQEIEERFGWRGLRF
jgi:hypothetical protein